MARTNENDYLIRILVAGEPKSGKSCLLLRYCDDTYTDKNISTLGVEYKKRNIHLNREEIQTRVWEFDARKSSKQLSGAHVMLLTLDVTQKDALKNTLQWLRTIEIEASKNVTVMFVGTKCDSKNRCIGKAQIDDAMRNMPDYVAGYCETSAKLSTEEENNVNMAFETAVTKHLERMNSPQEPEVPARNATFAQIANFFRPIPLDGEKMESFLGIRYASFNTTASSKEEKTIHKVCKRLADEMDRLADIHTSTGEKKYQILLDYQTAVFREFQCPKNPSPNCAKQLATRMLEKWSEVQEDALKVKRLHKDRHSLGFLRALGVITVFILPLMAMLVGICSGSVETAKRFGAIFTPRFMGSQTRSERTMNDAMEDLGEIVPKKNRPK